MDGAMMKCPYACDIEQVNQDSYEYDDDSRNTFHEHKLVEHRTYINCLQEECTVFYDGKCHYNG